MLLKAYFLQGGLSHRAALCQSQCVNQNKISAILKELRKWQNTRGRTPLKDGLKMLDTFVQICEGCLSSIHNSGFANTGESLKNLDVILLSETVPAVFVSF